MTVTHSVHDYYMEQHSAILESVTQCLVSPDKANIHKLRLRIKKIMAFNLLAEMLCAQESEEHIHISRKIRKLFKLAGKVRDLQVQLDFFTLLPNANSPEKKRFAVYLQKKQDRKISAFSNSPHAFIHHSIPPHFHENIRLTLAKTDTEQVKHALTQVMQSLKNYRNELQSKEISNKELHTLRKTTKQLRYLISISKELMPDLIPIDSDIESLRNIEAFTGRWHDRVIGYKLLHSYIKKHTRPESKSRKNLELLLKDVHSMINQEYIKSIAYINSL